MISSWIHKELLNCPGLLVGAFIVHVVLLKRRVGSFITLSRLFVLFQKLFLFLTIFKFHPENLQVSISLIFVLFIGIVIHILRFFFEFAWNPKTFRPLRIFNWLSWLSHLYSSHALLLPNNSLSCLEIVHFLVGVYWNLRMIQRHLMLLMSMNGLHLGHGSQGRILNRTLLTAQLTIHLHFDHFVRFDC